MRNSRSVDLATVATQAISLTEPKWRRRAQASGITIHIETKLFSPCRPSLGDESAIHCEVLTSLIFNAVDAMPGGGVITLETLVENNRAVIRVSDTGSGMTEAMRQRCLEPFLPFPPRVS